MQNEAPRHIDRQSTYLPRWSRTARDYARHRAGFPASFYARVEPLLGPRVLDVGTGTGTVARALARRGHAVTAIDVAAGQLAEAVRLANEADLAIDFRRVPAEHTGLEARSFDVAIAAQCWHWLDRPKAALEMRRLLRPGGRLLLAHLDWIPRAGNVVEASVALVRAHRRVELPHLERVSLDGLYGPWLEDLHAAGFERVESFSFDVAIAYTAESWRGRMRASAHVGATLDDAGVARFDADLAEALTAYGDAFPVPHRVFVAHAEEPS